MQSYCSWKRIIIQNNEPNITVGSSSEVVRLMQSSCYTCVVIILSFPLLVWPSLQPSPPWWTTTSATTTWGKWSPSQCTQHPRSPRPGTRQFPDTCLGKKTSQGRLKSGSFMNDSTPMHYSHIDTLSVGLNNHVSLSCTVDISWCLLAALVRNIAVEQNCIRLNSFYN